MHVHGATVVARRSAHLAMQRRCWMPLTTAATGAWALQAVSCHRLTQATSCSPSGLPWVGPPDRRPIIHCPHSRVLFNPCTSSQHSRSSSRSPSCCSPHLLSMSLVSFQSKLVPHLPSLLCFPPSFLLQFFPSFLFLWFILYPIVLLSLYWSWPLFPIPPQAT